MLNKSFWSDLVERAIKTFAQTLLAVLAVGVPIWEMDWVSALGLAAGTTVLSVLTSIASAGAGNHGTASLMSVPGRHRAGE
ncbi:holin [Corynebacterium phage CL31]|nr:holin [Corynebacterium phage CL31]